jgi:hypothetical protein
MTKLDVATLARDHLATVEPTPTPRSEPQLTPGFRQSPAAWTDEEIATVRRVLRETGNVLKYTVEQCRGLLPDRSKNDIERTASAMRQKAVKHFDSGRSARTPYTDWRDTTVGARKEGEELPTLAALVRETEGRCPRCGSRLLDDRVDRLACINGCWSRHYAGGESARRKRR